MIKSWRPIILVASGNSIPFNQEVFKNDGNGLPLHLKEIIETNYSIGMNMFYKFGCETTINSWVDWNFLRDNINEMEKLPLLIGKKDPQLFNTRNNLVRDNMVLLDYTNKYYGKDSWFKGFYSSHFVSLFSLTLAIALGFKEIYILGLDGKEIDGKTHFYENLVNLEEKNIDGNLKFGGVGVKNLNNKKVYNTSTYNNVDSLNKKWYTPYTREKDVKIYNVSPNSVIDRFPKIRYEDFCKKVKWSRINQTDARNNIKQRIHDVYNKSNSHICYSNILNIGC